jgi:hypothetical protein
VSACVCVWKDLDVSDHTRYDPITVTEGTTHLVLEYPLTPIRGREAIVTAYTQPTAMIFPAVLSLSRLFRWMAYVMVYHRSQVITVSVKIDNSLAKTVRNPATWQPAPAGS